jgi:CHAT domain-containing protein/tetratricopeptide (TPR) repeat protein
MFNKLATPLLGLLVLVMAPAVLGQQTPAPPVSQNAAPGLLRLTGADARRAEELDKAIVAARKADRWDEAIARAEELLALRAKVQGPKHFKTVNAEWSLKTLHRVAPMPKEDRVAYQSAITMNEQAQALNAQGKSAAARPLFEKALEIRRRLLTDDHPDTATSYSNLAHILWVQGKYAQAQPLCEKALEIHRRLLSDDHPDTAMSYSDLAANLNDQGKYVQAQPLYEKALEIARRLLSDDHPDTATSYNNLAYNLAAQGKYAAAQPLYQKALEIRRRLLSDDHPDTATSYNNLAHNLWVQGKYVQAQPLFEKALEISRRLLTDDHSQTARSYHNLAANHNAQGKYAAAQPLYEKALEIRRRLLTDDHPDTATSYNTLAGNLNAQGQYAQAQPLYEKALEIHRRLLTDNHPQTARSYNNLAANLNAQGQYAATQPLYEKALEIHRRLLSDDHPQTAMTYNNLAVSLNAQGKYAAAQPLFEKALEIWRRLLTDDHPDTANGYGNLAGNLTAQGKYAAAQPLYEKALEISRRLLTDDHPQTAISYNNVAYNLNAQGQYREARDQWLAAARSQDVARLLAAFTGLERTGAQWSARPALAAVLARLGQPAQAWPALEEDLGRGLLDELAARQDRRMATGDRARLHELTAELERLDKVVETSPKGLDQAQRAQRFDDLKRQLERASIALGEFQTKLVQAHGPLAGQAAQLKEIQAALPADAALVAWVDVPPPGPKAADPDGEHWGVVVRSRGIPAWVSIAGTDPKGLWTKGDTELANRVRTELRRRSGSGSTGPGTLLDRLRTQRIQPLARALAAAEGLPPARRLIVLPSPALAGIPIEAILAPDDTRTVSYAPSATVWKYLREQPRPDRHAGLLALGDPVFQPSDSSRQPKPLPDHGLLVTLVAPGSNAKIHDVKAGDVLLAYNGVALHKSEDFKTVPEPGGSVPVEVWREGQVIPRAVAAGKLGVVLDPRPAPQAIAEQRKLQQILVAARSGDEDFAPLPGTHFEVEALTRLFQADDRPIRALFGAGASELELDRVATSGELTRYGFIHLATHGVINEEIPSRSAVILSQTGLPDPLQQALSHQPVFDGRLSVREIQHTWEMKAELVTLSACQTALGRASGGEGFVGFTQALLMSGARSVCLSLWKVDDIATALLMQRFYANLLGRRPGLTAGMPRAEALQEAKTWLRELRRSDVLAAATELSGGVERGKGAKVRQSSQVFTAGQANGQGDATAASFRGELRRLSDQAPSVANDRPYAAPYYWAAFVLSGDPG